MEKKIFLVNESLMNGTVTLQTWGFGIEADNFEEAKKVLMDKLNNMDEFVYSNNDLNPDKYLRYSLNNGVSGEMKAQPMNVYKEKIP